MIHPQLELDLGSKPHRVPLGNMADATSSHDGLYICVQTVGCQNFCTWALKCFLITFGYMQTVRDNFESVPGVQSGI